MSSAPVVCTWYSHQTASFCIPCDASYDCRYYCPMTCLLYITMSFAKRAEWSRCCLGCGLTMRAPGHNTPLIRFLILVLYILYGLAESNGSLLPGLWRDSLHVTCGLTACTPGSATGPTLGNKYGKTLPILFVCLCCILSHLSVFFTFSLLIFSFENRPAPFPGLMS